MYDRPLTSVHPNSSFTYLLLTFFTGFHNL